MRDVESSVMRFLAEIPTDRPIKPDTELMTLGVLDSTALVRLILFLESEFKITIFDTEITPESFATPRAIAAFITGKTRAV
jgi:acyl carrier protein